MGGVDVVSAAHSTFVRKTMQRLAELKHVRVHARGRLGHHEVLAAYEEADVFVFPSDYEPFGLVLLEAMQAGLPVLAFDADGPRDVLTQTSGWLVSRGDWPTRARRLAEAMAGLFACETRQRMAMGDAARARASEFTWSRCAAAHLHALGA
jgi:glycosyltransferase involved in cell wall biosynthesis